MRKVDGIQEFRVAWAQTWMPESDLGGAGELVEEFKARLSVRHGKYSFFSIRIRDANVIGASS